MSKRDFDRQKNTAQGDEYTVDDTEYVDNTAAMFVSREALEKYSPLLVKHITNFGMEIHVRDNRKPLKKSKSEVLLSNL